MRRREFITLLGGAAAWPLAARAQQPERMRRIGVLSGLGENDPEGRARVSAFQEGLEKLGWAEGRNLQIVVRWSGASADHLQALAAELVQLAPDVIVASATASLVALQKATSTIPIVFAQVTDPVGAGFVKSLARPGGNITGFTQHDFSIGNGWSCSRSSRLAQNMSQSFTIQEIPQISGMRGPSAPTHRHSGWNYPTTLCATPLKSSVPYIDLHRRAASYVERILKGETPAELPVQNATKFELVVNLKTAKALGLEPPITLLARTDEVIE